MTERNPYDGKPYYCALCGLGLGEVMACEEPDCILESEEKARARQRGWRENERKVWYGEDSKPVGKA